MCYHNGSTSFAFGVIYLKKVFQWCYPIVFSIVSFLVFYISIIIINEFIETEGYGGIGIAALVVFVWILVVVPIYCFKYSKLICEEKRKFLFIIYNSLVIALCYTGPFMSGAGPSSLNVIIKIALALFVWVAICTYVSYLVRINTTKEPDENDSNEPGDSVTKV